jgi:hypothetical protein
MKNLHMFRDPNQGLWKPTPFERPNIVNLTNLTKGHSKGCGDMHPSAPNRATGHGDPASDWGGSEGASGNGSNFSSYEGRAFSYGSGIGGGSGNLEGGG